MQIDIRPAALILVFQLCAVCSPAQPSVDRLSSELEKVAPKEMKAAGIPGAAIGIVSHGKILLAKGYGVASVETGAPVSAQTLFRLGSTTKMFTAAALVGMALDGKIDLHRPIGEYVRGLDPTLAKLTADQLLSHTAGLWNDDLPSGSSDESALGREMRW